MYPTTVNIFENPDFTSSSNQSFTPAVFDCVSSPSLNINTTTFPTPKEEEYYMFECSPHSSNNGQMTPLSPCSITDQQNNNLNFVYNPVVNEMTVVPDLDQQQFVLSNRKIPEVTHHASNSVMKSCNQPFISNEYTVQDTLNAPTISNQPVIEHRENVVSQMNSIDDDNNHIKQVSKNSSKEDGLFSSKNFRHMSREQLIARLLVLENEKNTGTSQSKAQVATQCCWKNCNKNFETLKKLISHLTEVHVGGGKASYQCEWRDCPRIGHPFTKRHKMHNHLRTHTGERPFTCSKPDCKKKFSRLDSLTTHLKTHSNIRPYVCLAAGCGKAYYHSRSLKKHEKIHESQPQPPPPSSSSSTSVTHQSPLKSSMVPQDQSFLTYDHQQFTYTSEKMPTLVDYNNSFILNSENI